MGGFVQEQAEPTDNSASERGETDNGEHAYFELVLEYQDFKTFFTKCLGFSWNWHLEEIYKIVESKRFTVVQSPRGSGKTTLVLGYLAWKMFLNPKLEILVVCNAWKQATERLHILKRWFESIEILKQFMPENKKDTYWSKEKIETINGCIVTAKANNENIRGGHYDYIFCDEVGQYEDKSNFYAVIEPTTHAKKGKIIGIGTPESKVDLLWELSYGNGSKYVPPLHYQALKKHPDGSVSSLWPERFSIEDYEKIKNGMPALEWEREYQCNPIGDSTSLFPYELIVGENQSNLLLDESFLMNGIKEKRYYMGVDFAKSVSKRADSSVWTILEVDDERNKKIVRIEYSQGEGFEDQVERTKRLYGDFHLRRMVIDKSSFGDVFFERFKKDGFIVGDYLFHPGPKSSGRERLFINMRNQFENKKLKLPFSRFDKQTRDATDLLVNQLMSITPTYTEKTRQLRYDNVSGHEDFVISLGLAIEAANRSFNLGMIKVL